MTRRSLLASAFALPLAGQAQSERAQILLNRGRVFVWESRSPQNAGRKRELQQQARQMIAKARELKVQIEMGLIETNVGKWQGRSLASLRLHHHWKVVQQAPSRAQFPEGETFYECQMRIVAALDKILTAHRPKDVIACVFHADPIKLAVAHFLGMPLDHFQRLSCDTGSLTALYVSESVANLIKLNQRPPFEFLVQQKKTKADGKT